MPKRPRGRAAKQLKKKAEEIKKSEKPLQNGSSWGALGSDDEGNDDAYDDSDAEQDYEQQPRKFQIQGENEVERLPVKTSEGQIRRVVEQKHQKAKQESDDEDSDDHDDEGGGEKEGQPQEASQEEQEDGLLEQEADEEVDKLTEKQRINQAKEQIAEWAELLSENPEENIGRLRELRELIARSKFFKVKRLGMLALVPIFKDIIPAYRIHPLTEVQQKEKVSKEVRQLRNFEQKLLGNYKEYVEQLERFVKKGKSSDPGTVRYYLNSSAITAACELLEAVPHFNYQQELIGMVVEKLSSKRVDKVYERCIKTVEHVFKNDDEGHVSFQVVRLMTKMIKARHYKVDPLLISTFMQLRLLTEFNAKADTQRITDGEESGGKKTKKKDRKPLSKKERKNLKEQKQIEEEYRKAENEVSHEERQRLQGETLKLVFVLYFNILKERISALMAITLEGLAKFSHLVNTELFGDLLVVLRELIEERQMEGSAINGIIQFKESKTREALLCVSTAFALLSGQHSERTVKLDLSFFINHFYSMMYALAMNPDIEFSHKTLRLEDPLGEPGQRLPSRVDVSTETEMMVHSFESIFFKQKGVGKLRVEAFAKRLATAMLHMPDKSMVASLKILDKMNKKYTAMPAMYYTDDKVGNGVYHPQVDQPEQSNPEAATIWETLLLEQHCDPKISKAARSVLRTVSSGLHNK